MATTPPPILPYGIFDLSQACDIDPGPPLRMRCFVEGCTHYLQPPRRKYKGEVCPRHGIRVHVSRTYSYGDPTRNFIIDGDIVRRIIRHPFKFETHRLGFECSEDGMSLNVMRSFQEAGCLHLVARYITGLEIDAEPVLFLWGLRMSGDSLEPWDLLIQARQRFERKLPVQRPYTENDISLFLEGHYLIHIEAKLKTGNVPATDGSRPSPSSLLKSEILRLYDDPSLKMLDRKLAAEVEVLYGQLYRNVVFAEHMANLAGKGTRAYFANLTRRGYELESYHQLARLVRPEYAGRVCRLSWEDLYVLAGMAGSRLSLLREYLLTKTLNLQPALDLWAA